VLLVYGIVQGGDGESWVSSAFLGPALGGLAVLALFGWYEARMSTRASTCGLQEPGACRPPSVHRLLFFAWAAVYFFSSFYLQNVRGYSPLETGLLAVPFARRPVRDVSAQRVAGEQAGRAPGHGRGMLMNAVAIGGWGFLDQSSPIWIVAVSSSSRARARPGRARRRRHRHGGAAARAGRRRVRADQHARQVAVALSVAVLGLHPFPGVRNSLDPTLSALPAAARNGAGSSITATQAVAAQLGHAGQFLLAPANSAFVDAMRVTTAIAGPSPSSRVDCCAGCQAGSGPTIEELVAAEVAAAERELEAGNCREPRCWSER